MPARGVIAAVDAVESGERSAMASRWYYAIVESQTNAAGESMPCIADAAIDGVLSVFSRIARRDIAAPVVADCHSRDIADQISGDDCLQFRQQHLGQ